MTAKPRRDAVLKAFEGWRLNETAPLELEIWLAAYRRGVEDATVVARRWWWDGKEIRALLPEPDDE